MAAIGVERWLNAVNNIAKLDRTGVLFVVAMSLIVAAALGPAAYSPVLFKRLERRGEI
jgi:hypothetical protein